MKEKEDIHEFAGKINDIEGFREFTKLLYADYEKNKDKWENTNLERFLEALSAYAEDVDGYYKNWNINVDIKVKSEAWRIVADILLGATIYE